MPDPTNNRQPIALVTGANRGLGLEISRQLAAKGMLVLMGSRDISLDNAAAQSLRDEGFHALAVPLDLTKTDEIDELVTRIDSEFGRLDIPVNNAAVLLDNKVQPTQVQEDALRKSFEVNFFSPFVLTQKLATLLRRAGGDRVVNMGTGVASLNQLADPDSPLREDICPAYQTSKAALNALTLVFAKEFIADDIKVHSACPGWVMTDRGHEDLPDYGDAARPKPAEEGVGTPVWLATRPASGPTGGFYSDRRPARRERPLHFSI